MDTSAFDSLDIGWRSALLLSLLCPTLAAAGTLLFRQLETVASRYLAAFLFLFCLNMTPQVIGFAGFYQAFPWLTFAPFNNELWLGPLLLLHTIALAKRQNPNHVFYLFVPGAVQTSYYAIAFLTLGNYQQKWQYNDAIHHVYIMPVESVLTFAVTLFSTGAAFRYIRQYQQDLLHVQSDQDSYDVTWLKWLVGLVGLLVAVWSLFEVLYWIIPSMTYIDQYPFQVVFCVIALVLSQRALSSIRLPYPKPLAVNPRSDDLLPQSEAHQDLVEKIARGLKQDKWYLNRQFSLSEMARALNTNESYVSKAINSGFDKNFNTLVNEARVDHAKLLISRNPAQRLTDVFYDSGFSSKASFNRCFKAVTGQTPSQYQLHCVDKKAQNSTS